MENCHLFALDDDLLGHKSQHHLLHHRHVHHDNHHHLLDHEFQHLLLPGLGKLCGRCGITIAVGTALFGGRKAEPWYLFGDARGAAVFVVMLWFGGEFWGELGKKKMALGVAEGVCWE